MLYLVLQSMSKPTKKRKKSNWMKGFIIGQDKKDPLALSQQEARATIADTYAKGRQLYKVGEK
jgi:hypothetical protein